MSRLACPKVEPERRPVLDRLKETTSELARAPFCERMLLTRTMFPASETR